MNSSAKRLKKAREKFIKMGTAIQPVKIDYLPEDHWIRFRIQTERKAHLGAYGFPWYWNVYGANA